MEYDVDYSVRLSSNGSALWMYLKVRRVFVGPLENNCSLRPAQQHPIGYIAPELRRLADCIRSLCDTAIVHRESIQTEESFLTTLDDLARRIHKDRDESTTQRRREIESSRRSADPKPSGCTQSLSSPTHLGTSAVYRTQRKRRYI